MTKEQHIKKDILLIDTIQTSTDVLIVNRNKDKLLLGLRGSSVGNGEWSILGGKQYKLETIKETAEREIVEEIGTNVQVQLGNKLIAARYNCLPPHFKPHLTFIIEGILKQGVIDVPINEPTQIWNWFDFSSLPSPLFSCNNMIIDSYIKGNFNLFYDNYDPMKNRISPSNIFQEQVHRVVKNIAADQQIDL